MPKWLGPPDDVLGGDVCRQLVVGRTDSIAVVISRLVAYPSGYTVDLAVLGRTDDTEVPDMMGHRRASRTMRPGMSEGSFRFGVLMSDGSRADNSSRFGARAVAADEFERLAALDRPPEPLLAPRGGGGGGGRRWDWRFWAAPLPPPGALTFFVQWLDAGLPEASVEMAAQDILDAAALTRPIWED